MVKRALLMSAVLIGGHACAQSSIRVYGIMDAALEAGRFNRGVRLLRLQSGDLQASRFGLTGREDLGDGMAAHVQMEMGIALDTGAAGGNTLWNRGSAVGLEGRWGRVDAGRQYAPMFWVYLGSDVDTYGIANPSVLNALQHTVVLGKTGTGGFYDNVLRYRTPVIRGLEAEASWSTGNELAGARARDGRNAGFSVQYRRGPGWFGVAWNRYTSHPANAVDDSVQRTALVAAAWDFGRLKLGANALRTANMAAGGAPLAGDARSWQINARLAVSGNDINAGFARLNESAGRSASALHLGYVHFLSKRTQLYAYLSRIANNANGTRGLALLNAGEAVVEPGYAPAAATFGIRTSF
ncbi:porin [Oxalobacteraceae bacterium OM1]|nr:porin [Oxalobacteraceae bacterium OM1]